jgi:hypothetical protein
MNEAYDMNVEQVDSTYRGESPKNHHSPTCPLLLSDHVSVTISENKRY